MAAIREVTSLDNEEFNYHFFDSETVRVLTSMFNKLSFSDE